MGFGRDLRSSLFHQVTDFSAREVGTFGAPSLITRITNDVQQVQMLVRDGVHDGRSPRRSRSSVGVILAVRQDVGLSIDPRRRDARSLRHRARHRRLAHGARVPADAGAHRPGQPGAARADHRHPRRAGVRARARGGASGSATPTTTSPTTSLRAGRLMASMFPTVILLINVSSVAVLWLGAQPHRQRARSRSARCRVPHATSSRS